MEIKKKKTLFSFNKINAMPFWVLIALTLLHAIYAINTYNVNGNVTTKSNIELNPYYPVFSVFTLWIGGNHLSVFSKIFYLFPFIVPFSLKYEIEPSLSIKRHTLNYATAFLASGMTISLPLLCNFLIVMLFFPVSYPDSIYDIYCGIFSNSFMGELFYTMPFLYTAIFLILILIFYGLLGGLCYTLYQFTKQKLFSICTPPLFTLTLHLVEYFQKGVVMENNQELSPMIYLNPACSRHTSWLIITTEYSILFLITVILFMVILKLHRKEGFGA